MKVLYYTNRDKLKDEEIPRLLTDVGHEVLIDYQRPNVNSVAENNVDFIISDRARYLIEKSLIENMPGRIINLHPSFLPWGRGYHPILAGIIENTCLGVTIHLIDEDIDTGDILLQRAITVSQEDTLATLYQKHRDAMLELLKNNLDEILNQRIKPQPQNKHLGDIHYKKQFEPIIPLLNNGWDTSVSWVRHNLHSLELANGQ